MPPDIRSEHINDQIAEAVNDHMLLVVTRRRIDHAKHPQPTQGKRMKLVNHYAPFDIVLN